MVSKSVVGMVWKVKKKKHEKTQNMKHEKGFGCFMTPRGGKGLGKLKMKHEKGLGAPWFPRVGWEGLGKAQNEA